MTTEAAWPILINLFIAFFGGLLVMRIVCAAIEGVERRMAKFEKKEAKSQKVRLSKQENDEVIDGRPLTEKELHAQTAMVGQ